jgi:phage terminase large subunit GpA-like protein
VRSVEWIPAHVVIPEETETPGLFDLELFPYVRGVLEAVDDQSVREIYMQWAARNAKTTTALACLLFWGCTAPRPSLFGSSNEEKADETIDSQLYPMLEACRETRYQLRPKHMRNKRYVALDRCRIRRSFSGAPSTMAGFPACYGVASEVSKWTTKRSTEASPLKLFTQRAKLYPFESKFLFESTPGLKGHCAISALMEHPDTERRRYWCPCPHCGAYQLLKLGTGEPGTGGLIGKRGPNGRTSVQHAAEHTYYECEHKGCKIENQDRPAFIRGGVWLSEGQSIRRGRIVGEPKVRSHRVGFGPLSSLHSLAIAGWEQILVDFLTANAEGKEALRDFVNSTLAEPWDPAPVHVTAHDLAGRLCTELHAAGVVPSWSRFLTLGVDVQETAERFVWVLAGWGDGGRGAELAHGQATWDDLVELLRQPWSHADGGPPLFISLGLMDSGDEAETVYQLCRQVRNLRPAKGLSKPIRTEYREVNLKADQRRSKAAVGDVLLLEINTDWTQRWLQKHLNGERGPNDAAFALSIHSRLDLDFLDQLLNEQRIEEIDARGYPTIVWQKRTSGPNDYRDALRLAKVAGSRLTDQGKHWTRLPPRPDPKQPIKRRRQADEDVAVAARDYEGFSAR